jgi:hemoglobin-like flavoprotein
MTLTTKQIKLVEDSWDFIITNTSEAGAIFYGRLFEQSPHLRSLFKEDIKSQEKKLLGLITFAVGGLNNLDKIVAEVQALGTRHKGYGVKDEYYNDVAAALLWTLEQALGSQWNNEVKEAWTAVYLLLAGVLSKAPETK